jgi:hypothetical protein
MSQITRAIVGILFLLISVVTITLIRINPHSITPTRSTESRMAGIMEGILKGNLIIQDITVIKDYLSGVDLVFSQGGRNNTNEITFLLLDANFKELYKKSLSAVDIKDATLTSFQFEDPIFIGTGKMVHLLLFSNDGTQNNTVSPLYNQTDSIGQLYVSQVTGNDLVGSIKNKVRKYNGSLMLRTYGTDSSQFWLLKIFLYFLCVVLSCLIIWFSQLRSTLARIRIMPEWVFIFIAVPASTVFAFITPPLQVPDEGSHFSRAYQISEFDFTRHNNTGPASMVRMDSVFGHLHFLAGEKTSMAEIKSQLGVKLEPSRRVAVSPPAYTLPYIPQALGIFAGRITDSSPLTLMYLGRIFNLLISILLLFFAIRIIPQFKWIFLLLALMPKTLFLFGSLSYDSLTISLSFLTIAVFFYYAYACERNIGWKDLAVMALMVMLLLFCKPPYFILGLLFFFIPGKKFGALYKYILIAIGVVTFVLIIYVGGPVAAGYFSGNNSTTEVAAAAPSDTTPLQASV